MNSEEVEELQHFDLEALRKQIMEQVEEYEWGKCFCVERTIEETKLDQLSAPIRNSIARIQEFLTSQIPNDIDFTLSMNESECCFSLDYNDGRTTCSTKVLGRYQYLAGVGDDLKTIDWDAFRIRSLQGTGIFEQLVEASNERPVNIPSTEEAQVFYFVELQDFLALEKVKGASWAVMAANEYEIDETFPESFNDLMGDLGNLLTCSYEIIAITRNGSILPLEEIEKLKRDAIEGLGPISRAKAEGRAYWCRS